MTEDTRIVCFTCNIALPMRITRRAAQLLADVHEAASGHKATLVQEEAA